MRSKNKILLMGLILLCATLLSGCGTKKINLNDCVDVTIQGRNGEGEADVRLNGAKLEELLQESLSDSSKDSTEIIAAVLAFGAEDYVEIQVNKEKNLSNGDVVEITANIDNKRLKRYKLKFEFTPMKINVTDLGKVVHFDPFEKGLVVEGYSPLLTVHIDGGYISGFNGNARIKIQDHKNFYRDGDIIKATYEYDAKELEEFGFVPDRTEAEFTVKGHEGHYVDSFDELDESIKTDIINTAQSILEEALANATSQDSIYENNCRIADISLADSHTNPKLRNLYFFYNTADDIPPDIFGTAYQNVLYLIFSVDFIGQPVLEPNPWDNSPFKGGEKIDFPECYIDIKVKNIIKNDDGTWNVDLDKVKEYFKLSGCDFHLTWEDYDKNNTGRKSEVERGFQEDAVVFE